MKKYSVDYCSGSTGYGWTKEYDRLDEFEDFVDECRKEYTTRLVVWDNDLKDHIFWKDCLSSVPEIDMLSNVKRDMRTTTREWK